MQILNCMTCILAMQVLLVSPLYGEQSPGRTMESGQGGEMVLIPDSGQQAGGDIQREALSDPLLTIIESGSNSGALWSIIVTDSTGRYLEQYNEDKLVRPASTFKLISSSAFLQTLGPDFRYQTNLYGTGSQEGNRWAGDLVIKGSGDPTISGDFYDGDAFHLFEKWYELLSSMGIDQIDGNLIGNESYFDDIPYPKGWDWDDLTFYYGVETGALTFNNNVVELEVLADGPVGSTPEIQWFPFNTPYVDFINEQVIAPRMTSYQESYLRLPGTNTILLRSSLPAGYIETEPLSITRPALYFLDTFKRYLELRGITVNGDLIPDRQYRDWENRNQFTLLDEHESVPLNLIAEEVIRESNNFYAEMLLKTVAAETFSVEGSTELGIRVVKRFMHAAGLDSSATVIRDGSGLASPTLVRADDLNRLLHSVKSYDWYHHFYRSLSVGGADGTLQYRFQGSPVRGNFRGKTGFMTGVRTLNGYLETAAGNELAVTIITNNHASRTSVVDNQHERILEYLYSVY